MTDNDLMTFGKFKGVEMANVPAWWLVWFWDESKGNKPTSEGEKVLKYIKNYGIDYLRKEAKNG